MVPPLICGLVAIVHGLRTSSLAGNVLPVLTSQPSDDLRN